MEKSAQMSGFFIHYPTGRIDTVKIALDFMRQETLKTNDFFRCPEFTLICALVYFGFPIEAFEKDQKAPERVIAAFKRTDDLDQFLANFWNRQIKVEPISFWETVRQVKARIRASINYETDR